MIGRALIEAAAALVVIKKEAIELTCITVGVNRSAHVPEINYNIPDTQRFYDFSKTTRAKEQNSN